MRIAILLLIFGFLQAYCADSYSQRTTLSLDCKDTKLINVLDVIENNSEFFFLYNEKLIDTERKVSITTNDELINNILDNLFVGTDVKYDILDRKIILAPSILQIGPRNTIRAEIRYRNDYRCFNRRDNVRCEYPVKRDNNRHNLGYQREIFYHVTNHG